MVICVVGLGYVGLPLALEFAKKIHVIGFDINEEYIDISNKRIEGIIPYDDSNPNPKTKYIIKK